MSESSGHYDPEATTVLGDKPDATPVEQVLAAAEAKAEAAHNDYLRAIAELDNFRKRAQRDIENAHRYGLEKFAQELLTVKDTLELGLEAGRKAGEQADVKSLLAGKEATLQLLSKAFEKFKVVELNPIGAPFDPQLHEALTTLASPTAEPGSVLEVVQKGYQLNDRLLRPARVVVAKAPGT